MRDDGGTRMARPDLLEHRHDPRSQIVVALAGGEADARRRLHPRAEELRLGALDLVVRPAFETAEVDLSQIRLDEGRQASCSCDRSRGLHRASARARVDGLVREAP